MLIVGTVVSSISIFIAAIPEFLFLSLLSKHGLRNLILVDWLELNPDRQNPIILGLVFFIIFFTIGEAIWSPRLMQFSAEIAPVGREGTYIALSYLPYFSS
jgi:hypothetical protein